LPPPPVSLNAASEKRDGTAREDALQLLSVRLARSAQRLHLGGGGNPRVAHGFDERNRELADRPDSVRAPVVKRARRPRFVRGHKAAVKPEVRKLQRHLHKEVWMNLCALDQALAKVLKMKDECSQRAR